MADFTRNEIKRSYMELLEEKRSRSISVKDITDNCGIHKNTFYYHYSDIQRLQKEIVENLADMFISRYPGVTSIDAAAGAAIEFAKQNKKLIRHLSESSDSMILQNILWHISDYVVRKYFENLEYSAFSEEERNILIHSFVCESFGISTYWLKTGMKDDEVISLIKSIKLKKELYDLITAKENL